VGDAAHGWDAVGGGGRRECGVKFLVLGPLEILDGERRVRLGSAKQRLLLAALLVHANTVVSVDRLADILWGDAPPVDAAATLQNYVSRLRAILEPGRVPGDPGTMLLTRAPGYALRVDDDQVDTTRFEHLVADGLQRTRADDPAAGAALLDEALGLWRGPAFAEFADDDFNRAEARRLDELRRVALDERVEANLCLGRHSELIGELEGIVAADALRERPRAQLMLALYRCGREAEALRTYQQYRRYLGDELGIEPSLALQELEERILLQKPELNWTPSPALRDDDATAPLFVADIEAPHRLRHDRHDTVRDRLLGPAGGTDPVVVVPETAYAKSGDLSIAYQAAGNGPADVVLIQGSVSHIELGWETAPYAAMYRRLSRFARLITFDKRGTGLSDRGADLPTLEERIDDVRAVMDATRCEKATLVGMSEGGPMALLFAATYPERVTALVLWGTFARMKWAPDYPQGVDVAVGEEFCDQIRENWGEGQVFRWISTHDAPDDEATRRHLARFERNAATPTMAAALNRFGLHVDARNVLGAISAPTLVVHRIGDPLVGIANARYLAEHIRGARLAEFPGEFHMSGIGNDEDILDEIEEFLTGHRSEPNPDRILATMLFTDIVDSIRRASTMGDQRWRQVLDRHDEVIRHEIERFRGREVTTTGDGFLAVFDGPARAVHCAQAAIDATRRLGLDLRAGVHTGECECRGDDLGGIAVHIAARVAALAQPGQVLVSRTVTDLVIGSHLHFTDRGDHELEGVPGTWQLFAVQPSAPD
jgi:DNA-binding SARP family transcriptional activator/class 3 adenylate cyclase/alpha-beta hydrolase superfamily lysophospholipase